MRPGVLNALLVIALLSLMLGCNSIQVVDNTYGPVGGQYYQVSDELEYLGDPNVASNDKCVRDCPTISKDPVKITTELFANQVDGNISELCTIERRKLIGNFLWRGDGKEKVVFGDREYSEYYWTISASDDAYIRSYMSFLESKGYGLEVPGVVARTLVKVLNKSTKVHVSYACSTELMPEGVLGDKAKETAFLKQRFEERIIVID